MAKRVGKVKDMTGQKIGRLTFVRQVPSNTKRAKWLVKCDCGTEKVVTGKDVRMGTVTSCTCLRSEISVERARKNSARNLLPNGESGFNQLFVNYRFQAAKRNMEFTLSEDEFRKLTKGNCFYCGIEPRQEYHKGYRGGSYLYNGIDRVVNSEGYHLGNCVSCCGTCNDMKRTRSCIEFLLVCRRIVKYQDELCAKDGSISPAPARLVVSC